ncbi:MAG: hypothetical protein ACK55I_17425, partial [bacterium]
IGIRGRPRAHEPAAPGADEVVEHPAALPQPGGERRRQTGEDRVGVPLAEHLDARDLSQAAFQPCGRGVGPLRVGKPAAPREEADPGRRDEPHFGGELARLLAAVGELRGEFGAEEDDRLTEPHAV